MSSFNKSFVCVGFLAVLAVLVSGCGIDSLTVANGDVFAMAPTAPGSTPSSTATVVAPRPASAPGVIPVVVILQGTDPIYP